VKKTSYSLLPLFCAVFFSEARADIFRCTNAEEKKRLELEAEKRKAQQLADEERKREERYLQAHYESEADIQVARKRATDALLEKKRLANEQLQGLNQIISSLQLELKNTKKPSKEFDSMRQRADDLTSSINKSQNAITFYDQEIARTNQEYDQTLQRYRQVVRKAK
jgi:chromosome segregation ATPase